MQDTVGYAVAIAMVAKSCLKGRYEDYQQYETMRKLRMGFSSVYMSSWVCKPCNPQGVMLLNSNLSTAPPTHSGLKSLPRAAWDGWGRWLNKIWPFLLRLCWK
jgi:hypothetical protein